MTKESQIEESLIGKLTDLKYAEILQRAVSEIRTARTSRNLWDMKRFYDFYYQADTKLLQAVAVLPLGHNLLLLAIMGSAIIYFIIKKTINAKLWLTPLIIH